MYEEEHSEIHEKENCEILEAYKKWKVYVYEDLHAHYLRLRIAEFEAECKFDLSQIKNRLLDFYKSIEQPQFIETLLEKINLVKLPKAKQQNKKKNDIISNIKLYPGKEKAYSFDEINVFIDLPVELHVISTLFVLKSMKYLKIDNQSNYAFKPTFDTEMWSKYEHKSDDSVKFFEKYYIGYNSWLNNALKAVESHTKLGDNIVMISLDFKRFYYNIDFDFNKLDEFLLGTEFKKLDKARVLLNIIRKINEKYNEIYSSKIIEYQESLSKNGLPLGMIYSPILANWYLKKFDEEILNSITPIYYGRYIDDILIVINYKLDENKNKNQILKDIFCKKVFTIGEKIIKWKNNNVEHEINTEKYKLFNFNANGSNALIEVYLKEITNNSSAFRFLPEDKKIIKDFQTRVYSMQFKSESKNLYDIELFGCNKFSFSTYLSSAIKLVCGIYHKTKTFEGLYDEIVKYFFSQDILEYYELWEKLFTLFVLVGDQSRVTDLFNLINKKIININDRYLLEGLKNHLYSSLSMAMALNDNIVLDVYKEFQLQELEKLKKYYRSSYMIRASYVNNSAIIFSDYYKYDMVRNCKFDLVQDLFKMLTDSYKKDKNIFKKINKNKNNFLIPFKNIEYYKDLLALFEKIITNDFVNDRQEEKNKGIEVNSNQKDSKDNKDCKSYGIEKIKSLKVGVVNFETRDPFDTLEKNIKGENNTEIQNDITKLINQAAEKGCKLLVFPELAIPVQMYNKILDLCGKTHMGLICGLEYIEYKKFVYNFLLKVFPYQFTNNENGKEEWKVKVLFDFKKYYAPLEEQELCGKGFEIPYWEEDDNYLKWNDVRIGSLNCYEAASIELREKFKNKVDLLTISAHNRDLEYYENICKSTYRDIHCYLIQANVSKYGDSQIIQPAKNVWERELVKIKGNHNNTVFIHELDIEGLRKFQAKEFGLQNNPCEKFKPTPPGFDKDKIRKLIYDNE